MISWIQRTFQQHMRIIFGLLLVVTIISFVFIYNPASGIGTDDTVVANRPFFGMNLASASDQSRIMNDAALSVNLQVGFMGFDSEQLQSYAMQRVAALKLADEYRIGNPDTAELTAYLKKLRAFAGPTGEFDAVAYSGFRNSLRTGSGLSEGDVSRIISNDWRIDQVQVLLGGPGYVMDKEIRDQLVRADSNWTLDVATVDFAAFEPTVNPSESDLAKYFLDNAFRYEIPLQVRATYVDYSVIDLLPKAQVTDAEVRAYYDSNPGRFPKPAPAASADGAAALAAIPAASDPAADFAAVELQVRTALRTERALGLAMKDASDLAYALYDKKITRENLDAFLAERKLTRKSLAPFSQNAGPTELGGSPVIAREAFRLNAEKFYSDAIKTPGAGIVIFWEETLPVRQQVLANVRERVATDYKEDEKQKRFREAGRAFRTAIETRLKSGSSFAQATTAAATDAGLKVEAKSVPPFALTKPPTDLASPVLSLLEKMEKDQVSDMVVSSGKGYVIHVAAKEAPDLATTGSRFTEVKTGIANSMSRYNANSLLSEMVAHELAKSEPVQTP